MNLVKSVFPASSLDRWAKVALLPIVLAMTFSSSPLSATTLCCTMFDADADAGVEFGPDPLSGQSVPSGNAFVETGFSQAQTMSNLSNLSQAPSMSVRAEADTFSGVIGGGSGPT